jgi:phthalate 4,5-dioxygenase oxygenase subunit
MLSKDENDLLTRITGNAPAGQMLRRYWLPACWSDEVAEPDGTPVRVRMFGQDFVAFRDTAGTVALVDAACPHRRASLALGRNDAGGLRCIYHGWKFDARGACVDMPTEPGDSSFARRTRIGSYPVRDAGGLIWAYLGPAEHEPAFPAYDWTALPRDHIAHMRYAERANWLQCAEGTIDTTHSWFLHSGATPDWKLRSSVSMDFSPKLEAEDTPYGFRYAAIRRPIANPETHQYVKITVYAFPSTGIIARPMDDTLATLIQIFVPVDDERTMVYSVMHSFNGKPLDETAIRTSLHLRPGIDVDANWQPRFCTADGWIQDRAAMKTGASYTGIDGFPNQDVAVQESMGHIVDRSQEHLGTSDIAIIRMRKRMLESVRRFMAGEAPVGLGVAVEYANLYAEQAIIPIGEPWQSVGPAATHAAHAVRA